MLAYLSFFVPQSILTTKYIVERVGILAANPATCEHDWYVVASILSTTELQVQCQLCATFSEIPSPSKAEWDTAFGAIENPYPWKDLSRIRYYIVNDSVH